MDEHPAIDLTAVPLSALTAEIKRRRDEWESAQKDLAGFGVAPAAPASTTKRARHFSGNTMKAAATERWAAWKKWSKDNPGKTTTDYWKARKAGKV